MLAFHKQAGQCAMCHCAAAAWYDRYSRCRSAAAALVLSQVVTRSWLGQGNIPHFTTAHMDAMRQVHGATSDEVRD
jgi:hypothetical protein